MDDATGFAVAGVGAGGLQPLAGDATPEPVRAVRNRAGADIILRTLHAFHEVVERGERPSWDLTFAVEACLAASRGSCRRAGVGVAFVRNKRVTAKGYNGSAVGEPTCFDVGCDMEDGHCARTLHAELNGIADAAARGVSLQGTTAYVTHAPCWGCAKMLRNVGVAEVLYLVAYRLDPRVVQLFKNANVRFEALAVA